LKGLKNKKPSRLNGKASVPEAGTVKVNGHPIINKYNIDFKIVTIFYLTFIIL